MGWSFKWASRYESDFNFDFGVSAAEDGPHEAAPLLEANEVAARPLLRDQDVRDSLPPVAKYNADATGTDAVGYFAEGHGVSGFAREGNSVYHCYSSYARGSEFLMSYYAILDRTPRGREPADGIGSGFADTTSTSQMGRIVVSDNVSLDGVVQDPAGDEGFSEAAGSASSRTARSSASSLSRMRSAHRLCCLDGGVTTGSPAGGPLAVASWQTG